MEHLLKKTASKKPTNADFVYKTKTLHQLEMNLKIWSNGVVKIEASTVKISKFFKFKLTLKKPLVHSLRSSRRPLQALLSS